MNFHIVYKEEIISVERLSKDSNIYALEFPGEPVIFISLIQTLHNEPLWISIPQRNDELARELGKLIDEYLKDQQEKTTELG